MVGLCLCMAACWAVSDGARAAKKAGNGHAAAVPVRVATAESRTLSRPALAVGTVLAASTVAIKPQIDGQISAAAFTEGQTVKAGDLMFSIDARPFVAALNQAQANLARDRARLENAESELRRQRDLSGRGVASQQKLEQAQAEAKAQAATVAADEASVATARLRLGYTEIRSPISGKTGPILIHPGNVVEANGDNPMANALVVVSQIEPVRISLTLPQQTLPALQARAREGGAAVSITVPGDPGPPIRSRIDFIDAAVNPASGTIEVRATLANADHRLVPGQFVSGRIGLETLADVIAIPAEAVNTGPKGDYAYAVRDGKVEMRAVTVLFTEDGIAAVSGELAAGDVVVTDGQLRLAPGAAVHILDGTDPGTAP